ncbi:MAG: hypothetical protein RR949_08155, partial [Oscillospiraceae bacterium]
EGWEETRKKPKKAAGGKKVASEEPTPANLDRAMRRARAQVKDLALCSGFSYFVTLTLDRAVIDRYDIGTIMQHLNPWLDNRVRRKGLSYVLVPEHHKDGAIHFHGFFNAALPVEDSGHVDKAGHTVYHLPDWTLGYTTAIRLYGDYSAAVSYVCKYVGKEGAKIGGRWYYSGGELGHPEVELIDVSMHDFEGCSGLFKFSPEGSGKTFGIVHFDGKGGVVVYGEKTVVADGKVPQLSAVQCFGQIPIVLPGVPGLPGICALRQTP